MWKGSGKLELRLALFPRRADLASLIVLTHTTITCPPSAQQKPKHLLGLSSLRCLPTILECTTTSTHLTS